MLKLLIVDDSNIIRSRIERIYQDDSIVKVVGKAANGRIAIQLVNQLAPDIVTMDLTMPKVDGVACIERLKEIKPTIKILVVSALSDKATGIEALTKGARGFLCKPFTDDDLKSALDKLVKSSSRK
ncbi:MAG: response regulator transcription factor [Cellvibrionaceae bacterium]